MTKYIIILLSLIFSLNALAGDELAGEEITDRRVRGNIVGAAMKELVNAPFDETNLAEGLGQYLGRYPKNSQPALMCDQSLQKKGQQIAIVCDLVFGLGLTPSMKISFSGEMDPLGTNVWVDAKSLKHEVSF